jgi:methionyl-tRNA formyltransferase
MRFAMVCNDRFLGIFRTLVEEGWTPVKFFSLVSASSAHGNREALSFAASLDLPIQLSPIASQDLRALAEAECETLIVAEYDRLIPDWSPFLPHAVNFHPSPLPEARGRYPQVRAILEGRSEWAISCHKVSPELNGGDVLAAESFALGPDEWHESLDIKLRFAGDRLASRLAGNFAGLWDGARPQGEGSRWRGFEDIDRTLDFDQPVADILRQIRAFGELETIAHLRRMTVHVRRASGWTEPHAYRPETLVSTTHPIVIAAADGYICLHDWSLFPRDSAHRAGSHAAGR